MPRFEFRVCIGKRFIVRSYKLAGNTLQFFFDKGALAPLQMSPFRFDLFGKPGRRQLLNQDLDSSLVYVVAPAVTVVYTQHRIKIGQQVAPVHKVADDVTDDRSTPKSATDQYAKTDLAVYVPERMQADVMHFRCRAVLGRAVDRDLELARQESKFRMQRRPLTYDFAPYERINEFIRRYAGKLIRRHIAYAVSTSLNGMHLHFGKFGKNGRHVFETRPIELDVLPCAEVPIAAIIGARNVREFSELLRR